jgi:hypothetical protein
MNLEVTVPIKCSTVCRVRHVLSQAFRYVFILGLVAASIFLGWMFGSWKLSAGEHVVALLVIPVYILAAYIFNPFEFKCGEG